NLHVSLGRGNSVGLFISGPFLDFGERPISASARSYASDARRQMTKTSTDPSHGSAGRLTISIVRFHPLAALLLLAAAIRLPLAFWPNVLHPDEIFQYIEPAWRMLGHDGIVSWE